MRRFVMAAVVLVVPIWVGYLWFSTGEIGPEPPLEPGPDQTTAADTTPERGRGSRRRRKHPTGEEPPVEAPGEAPAELPEWARRSFAELYAQEYRELESLLAERDIRGAALVEAGAMSATQYAEQRIESLLVRAAGEPGSARWETTTELNVLTQQREQRMESLAEAGALSQHDLERMRKGRQGLENLVRWLDSPLRVFPEPEEPADGPWKIQWDFQDESLAGRIKQIRRTFATWRFAKLKTVRRYGRSELEHAAIELRLLLARTQSRGSDFGKTNKRAHDILKKRGQEGVVDLEALVGLFDWYASQE